MVFRHKSGDVTRVFYLIFFVEKFWDLRFYPYLCTQIEIKDILLIL